MAMVSTLFDYHRYTSRLTRSKDLHYGGRDHDICRNLRLQFHCEIPRPGENSTVVVRVPLHKRLTTIN
jgi:hypothetical protein